MWLGYHVDPKGSFPFTYSIIQIQGLNSCPKHDPSSFRTDTQKTPLTTQEDWWPKQIAHIKVSRRILTSVDEIRSMFQSIFWFWPPTTCHREKKIITMCLEIADNANKWWTLRRERQRGRRGPPSDGDDVIVWLVSKKRATIWQLQEWSRLPLSETISRSFKPPTQIPLSNQSTVGVIHVSMSKREREMSITMAILLRDSV